MGKKSKPNDPAGVLVVDKPQGITSHDVVRQVRRSLGLRRVGHAGTLDPMATGVLVVMVGCATKLAPYLTAADKAYQAAVLLGIATDSLDADGEVLSEQPLPDWCFGPGLGERLEAALECERQRSEQIPPALSAIKLAGKAAYARVRAGETLEMASRPVAVRSLHLEGFDAGRFELGLQVQKGYYVRSLARDLGNRLELPAHLVALRRTQSGCFDLNDTVPAEQWCADKLMGMATAACRALGAVTLSPQGETLARHGALLQDEHFSGLPEGVDDTARAWLNPQGLLVAIGARQSTNQWKVLRGFTPTESLAGRPCQLDPQSLT